MPEALFKTKAVKIDTLGEYLASVRNQLNLDIKSVSLLTQIKPIYIEKLEVGAYASLPADVYIRGFLKNLAGLYHIREQVLIDQYEKERGFEAQTPSSIKISKFKFSFTPKNLIIGISLFVALAALAYIVTEIKSVLAP